MYLKEIKSSGFKSFAEKIDLLLDDKITCIVGPNGSGKSNVVDAVRWVLGEQSVKSLRGEGSMSDVIFSGSKSRKALNVASVELVFDNNDHYLNVPYTEISIKRKVYRSGENEYILNGEKCRLKDIVSLLLDSGMGKESFNIISQGEVEKILSNSSYDRRVIFEEAAGILKYKKRKEEALRKLDRTHNNIDRVNDIISELEEQVEPLREQSIKAKEYKENKDGLDNLEVALLSYEIEKGDNELKEAKEKLEKLNKEITSLESSANIVDAKNLKDDQKLEELEATLTKKNRELLLVTGEVEKINGEKNLLKERSKTTKEEDEIKESIRSLLNEKKQLESTITVNAQDLETKQKYLKDLEEELTTIRENIDKEKFTKQTITNEYEKNDRELISIDHKIEALKLEKDAGGNIPNSVRNIIKNNDLDGIYNTIGNLIDIDSKYLKALDIAISASKNFIITKDEESAKLAINYLKDNHLGRATFFPLTVIKSRFVDKETLNILNGEESFIARLSDLLTFDKRFVSVIENQLGNVLVVNDIDNATRIGKKINNRYKIVTLDGDVVHVGGSMSGGSTYNSRSIFTIKEEINRYEKRKETITTELDKNLNRINKETKEIELLEDKFFITSRKKVEIDEEITKKSSEVLLLRDKLDVVTKEWNSYVAMNENTLKDEETKLIDLYYEKNTLKETLEKDIKSLTKEIYSLKSIIDERIAKDKLNGSELRKYEKEHQELDVLINRLDVKLDNMLLTLNEDYSLTFEKAKKDYTLEMDPKEAKIKVNKYKSNIKALGMVNLAAIEEFERVNTRYEFLTNQRSDLESAEATLLEIMNEMDEVMTEEFAKTFKEIQMEFRQVFKELFKGGNADLKLTEPNDLLNTGVEIVASPPGKKLTTISLLSGGEKTLTAISLLFAILNVRTVPFCLFDEVEAALDEANVEEFGRYLDHYKNKTQFLIITHKKKTMEYADTLYGITMQESGVSKLVSVRLNDKLEIL